LRQALDDLGVGQPVIGGDLRAARVVDAGQAFENPWFCLGAMTHLPKNSRGILDLFGHVQRVRRSIPFRNNRFWCAGFCLKCVGKLWTLPHF
jgi:hypothetical protein